MQVLPLILLSVIINTAAQLLLKAGMDRIGHFSFSWANIMPIFTEVATNPYIIAGIAVYVLAMTVWLLVLSRVEVGIAYPMVSLGYITTALAAYFLFGEHLTALRILGIGVILFGVFLVAKT